MSASECASPSEVDAEVLGDTHQPGGVALADGPELPLRAVAVQLAEDHGGLGGRVLAQVVAGDLGAAGLVDDADEGVADLTEVLAPVLGVVDGDGEDDLVDLGRDPRQVDLDLLVVAVAFAGEVVTGVLDRAVAALLVVEEDEAAVAADDLVVRVHHDGGGVDVEVGAGRRADVPAETDGHGGEAGGLLVQRDVATLAEADCHELTPSFCGDYRVKDLRDVSFQSIGASG